MQVEASRESLDEMLYQARHCPTLTDADWQEWRGTLRALLSERDAATARAEAAEARCDLFDTQAAAAKVAAAKAEAQRDAAIAERDRLRAALEKAAIAAEVESAGHAIAIIEDALTSAKEPSA